MLWPLLCWPSAPMSHGGGAFGGGWRAKQTAGLSLAGRLASRAGEAEARTSGRTGYCFAGRNICRPTRREASSSDSSLRLLELRRAAGARISDACRPPTPLVPSDLLQRGWMRPRRLACGGGGDVGGLAGRANKREAGRAERTDDDPQSIGLIDFSSSFGAPFVRPLLPPLARSGGN